MEECVFKGNSGLYCGECDQCKLMQKSWDEGVAYWNTVPRKQDGTEPRKMEDIIGTGITDDLPF